MLDWTDQACLVVASGPSAADVNLSRFVGRYRIIAVNNSHQLVPSADALYAADHSWWCHHGGVPRFDGVKVSGDQRTTRMGWGVEYVKVMAVNRMVFGEPGVVGRGSGSSGFQAINLAINWGARRLILVGFDMAPGRKHWHQDHSGRLSNPSTSLMDLWAKSLDNAHTSLRAMGIEVLNASPVSVLRTYPRVNLLELV